jgi:hypothetical protein
MSFTEVDLFGVYVAPMSLMIVAAWLLMIPIRRAAARTALRLCLARGPVRLCDLYDCSLFHRAPSLTLA